MKRVFLCASSALALAASVCASQAWAATAAAADTASAETPGVVGELVVVAQKREENIESVPVAITAFSSKQRDIMGLATTQDLSNFTPGLNYYSIADQAYIRGIGRNTVSLATASGVATYYNGIYYGANATIALQHDSLFIGNVEVDNGPQNSLHGSNADGGVISYTSQKPTNTLYAEGRAGIADYGYYYAEAVVSGPITDDVKFRIGGEYHNQSGGFFNNLDGTKEGGFGPQANGGEWGYAEGQLSTSFGHFDTWTILSTGDYNTNFHAVSAFGAVPPYEFPAYNTLTPSNYFGLCGLPSVAAANATACSATGQTVVPGSTRTAAVNAGQFAGLNPTANSAYNFIDTTNDENHQSNDVAFATTWTYHFPSVDLVYIGGYQAFNYNLHFNQTFDAGVLSYQIQGPAAAGNLTINPNGEFTHFVETDQYFSNEVNLLSTDKGPLQYVLGAYQYHEHFDQPISAQCYPNMTQLQKPLLGPANASSCAFQEDGDITYNDYAGFGHASYQFTDQWQFAGSVRYTYDRKVGIEQQRLVAFDNGGIGLPTANTLGAFTPAVDITSLAFAATLKGAPPVGAGPAAINPTTGFIFRPLNASWTALTGDATLNYKPDPDTLAYLRYARGYKAGGFNAGAISAAPESHAEFVDDFELGLKKTVGSNFLVNADAFYYNWYNDQQPLTVNQNGVNIAEVFNIPVAHIYGLELSANWRPIDQLRLSLEYDYLNATIANMNGVCVSNTADPNNIFNGSTAGCAQTKGTPVLQNLTGRTLAQTTPNKVALDAQYDVKFNSGTLTFDASLVWKDATFDTPFNEPLSLAPAYTTANLRAYFTDANDRFVIIAFVDNIGNTVAFNDATATLVSPSVVGGPEQLTTNEGIVQPLTFGAEFQYKFR